MEKRKEECARFVHCNAPLCPIDEQPALGQIAWFPGEDTCPRNDAPGWVKRQRRIARKHPEATHHEPVFDTGCFSARMLERKCSISRGLRGVDPNKGPPEEQEEEWLIKHPGLKPRKRSPAQIRAFEQTSKRLGNRNK